MGDRAAWSSIIHRFTNRQDRGGKLGRPFPSWLVPPSAPRASRRPTSTGGSWSHNLHVNQPLYADLGMLGTDERRPVPASMDS